MTSPEQWDAVDSYIAQFLFPPDDALDGALAASTQAGLPAIQVTPHQGKMLHLMARATGARQILEIGTLGGYSAIWLGRALPSDGRLISLEISEKHAEVARKNIERARLSDKVEVRLAPALSSLDQLIEEKAGPFDFFFIDADKDTTNEYFSRALDLSHVGSLIVVDNVVRAGWVADPSFTGGDLDGVRQFNERLATERRVSATEVQTVGAKGYDGFVLALVVA